MGQPLITALYSPIQQTLVVPRRSFINLRSTSDVVYFDNEKMPILFDVCTLFIPQDRTFTSRRHIFVYILIYTYIYIFVFCLIISCWKRFWALAYPELLNVWIYRISIMHSQQLDLPYDGFVLTWLPRLRCGAWSSILQQRLWSLCLSDMEGSRHGWVFFSKNKRYSSLAVRVCYFCG